MNSQPSPLQPQGTSLDSKNRGRARVKIAVFFVLAVHGIGLMALLMQGCRREEPAVPTADTNTYAPPSMTDTNIMPPVDNNVIPGTTNATTEPPPPLPDPNGAAPVNPGAGVATEYKVAKGDSFYTIAKKFNVTSKAIADANPTVNPTKLQIGQTLVIPAGGSATTAPAPKSTTVSAGSNGGGTAYTVKSGDNLTKIATEHGVTVKALRTANNLTTDRITVGQKLKIPAKSGAQ